jgi:hypothetical protein
MCLARSPLLSLLAAIIPAQTAPPVDPHLRVDQFGYRPNARKVAIVRAAVVGFDAPAPYAPGSTLQVRRRSDNAVVWQGPALAWRGGAVHADSGDQVWHFDFSALTTSGTYFVFDPSSNRSSADFNISADVYREALVAALRVFFYQRCGVAKATPHAHPFWSDAPCHTGTQQDRDCRAVLNPVPGTARDLSGGWHDAGDYNKYVNFGDDPVHGLLHAYLDAPAFWTDDYGIPESGNGTPDLLDEVQVELDWLLRMQNPDGALLHKVSVTDFAAASPPSADAGARRYAPATASATATGCHVFAHAAVAFTRHGTSASLAYAARLRSAALLAWNWLAANPGAIPSNYNNAGFVNVAAEDTPYVQALQRICAAAWLFLHTGDPTFRAFFDANHQQAHLFTWGWASPWEIDFLAAYLAYADAGAATPAIADAIRTTVRTSVTGNDHLGHARNGDDPYRAFLTNADYTWGSNSTKSTHGVLFALANRHGLQASDARACLEAAEGFVHYLHGVNPQGWTFLTNARGLGAEGSVDEMYHAWFADGTIWDNARTSARGPAPGYVTGGANRYYAPDPAYSGPPIVPPMHQPAMKCYRDWNTGWPQNSWEITEPAIGYQGRYVHLLASFAAAPPAQLGLEVGTIDASRPTPVVAGGVSANDVVVFLVALAPGRLTLSLPGLALDLGVQLFADPALNLFGVASAASNGNASATLTPLPSHLRGLRLWLQAAVLRGGEPVQSAVVQRSLR